MRCPAAPAAGWRPEIRQASKIPPEVSPITPVGPIGPIWPLSNLVWPRLLLDQRSNREPVLQPVAKLLDSVDCALSRQISNRRHGGYHSEQKRENRGRRQTVVAVLNHLPTPFAMEFSHSMHGFSAQRCETTLIRFGSGAFSRDFAISSII